MSVDNDDASLVSQEDTASNSDLVGDLFGSPNVAVDEDDLLDSDQEDVNITIS